MDAITAALDAHWILALLMLIAGVTLLWFSSDLVLKKLTPIAKHFGIREFVVAILGISVLSSLPEFTVSAFANLAGKSDISLGNIIGSNFVTLTFVTALCALIRPLQVQTEIKERESSWMILSTVVILILGMDGNLSRLDGAILMALYIPYIVSIIRQAKREAAESKQTNAVEKDKKIVLNILLVLAAIGGIILGAKVTLMGGESLGARLGISPLAMGVLIFALGTSLPELAIALSATFKNKGDISIGEIYASNIFTALFVLGACALISPMGVSDSIIRFDIPFLILAGVVIQIFIHTGNVLRRIEAVIVLAMYAYFVVGHFIPVPFLHG